MITRTLTNHPSHLLLLEVITLTILAVLLLNVMFRHRPTPLLELSMLSILILLSSYHRPYDAIVLMLLLAWLFSNKQASGFMVYGSALPFFQPLPTLGILATYFGKLPAAWPAGLVFAWRFVVGAHAAWFLLALFIALYLVAVENKPAPKND